MHVVPHNRWSTERVAVPKKTLTIIRVSIFRSISDGGRRLLTLIFRLFAQTQESLS